MIVGAVVLVAFFTLYILAYISKRRFGVLGLALAAGYVLSAMWTNLLTHQFTKIGIDLGVLSPATLVTLLITILPSVLLLFGGPVYRTKKSRLIGSLLYAALAVMCCLGAIGHSLVLMQQEKQLFELLMQYKDIILTVGFALALFDALFTHTILKGGTSRSKKDKH